MKNTCSPPGRSFCALCSGRNLGTGFVQSPVFRSYPTKLASPSEWGIHRVFTLPNRMPTIADSFYQRDFYVRLGSDAIFSPGGVRANLVFNSNVLFRFSLKNPHSPP